MTSASISETLRFGNPNVISPSMEEGRLLGGKYRLLRLLGAGGMGAVWTARNEATGGVVAVKLFQPSGADSSDRIARFQREARATGQLSHRNIVRIYDYFELYEDGGVWLAIVMELLHGETLAARLDAGPIEANEAISIALALLMALAHAHALDIVHRDAKPENIFLECDHEGNITPKLLDFGISKWRARDLPNLTRQGEMVGTPCYMSPEQARGLSVDARSDIFNVGILLYEMISGRNPFAAEGIHSIVVAILERDPPRPPLVKPALWGVIARALRKNPAQRFSSAAEMADALRAVLRDTDGRRSIHLTPTAGQHMPVVISKAARVRIALALAALTSVVAILMPAAVVRDVSAGSSPSLATRDLPRAETAVAAAVPVVVAAAEAHRDPIASPPPDGFNLAPADTAPAANGPDVQPEKARAASSAERAPTRTTLFHDPGF